MGIRALVLIVLLAATPQAAAQQTFVAPEDPLPPLPPVLPMAPVEPVFVAPDARKLLEECEAEVFTDCFRLWQPPKPPEPPQREARERPPQFGPPDPSLPRKPAPEGPLEGPPPPRNPAADKATYDELLKAIEEQGLQGKILLPDPPKDGSAIMKLNPSPTPQRNPSP